MSKKRTLKQSAKVERAKDKATPGAKPEGVVLDTFYMAFIGEFVELVGEFSIQNMTAVTNVQGYLLDVDEDFYYLGVSAEEINVGIRKTAVYSIQITEKPNPT